jgi:hypothetical protein
LHTARGDERLRAIFLLDAAPERSGVPVEPSSYKTRGDWQRALIAQRKQQVIDLTRATREALADMDLKLVGGSLSHALVVEGTAAQIADSLSLPGVRHASLDRPMEVSLGEPVLG